MLDGYGASSTAVLPPADHRHFLVCDERSVTGGAGGKRRGRLQELLRTAAQAAGGSAGGDNQQRVTGIVLAALSPAGA